MPLSRRGIILPLVKDNTHRRGRSKVDTGSHRHLVCLLVEHEGAEALEGVFALHAHTDGSRAGELDVRDRVSPVAFHHEDLLLTCGRDEDDGVLGTKHWKKESAPVMSRDD